MCYHHDSFHFNTGEKTYNVLPVYNMLGKTSFQNIIYCRASNETHWWSWDILDPHSFTHKSPTLPFFYKRETVFGTRMWSSGLFKISTSRFPPGQNQSEGLKHSSVSTQCFELLPCPLQNKLEEQRLRNCSYYLQAIIIIKLPGVNRNVLRYPCM